MSRILGIDYGLARVGLALSDPEGIIAQPWQTLKRTDDETLINEIAVIVDEKKIEQIIIGYPINLSGEESEISLIVKTFSNKLREALRNVKITLRDERLSSVEASAAIREMGDRPSRDKGRIDSIAASLVLQGFLESRIAE